MSKYSDYLKKIRDGREHHIDGQFNVCVLDMDSPCTGYGLHNRVMACLPSFCKAVKRVCIYARIDRVTGLEDPTDQQLEDAINERNGTKLKLSVLLRDEWDDQHAVDVYLAQRK